jgi:nitric oxide dioxygenase
MTKPLSAETITLVRASVPALAEHGVSITQAMYRRLFQDPQIRALFNHANQGEGGRQVNALAVAVLAYAQNIENLEVLLPAVERIAQKHIGYDIRPEHYPAVAEALLGAIAEVLGDAAKPEILAAWGEAYWFLADILKNREAQIRNELDATAGGWTGWRAFKVVEKRPESSVITSFVLRPVDGGPVLRHRPGQYLTLRFGEGDVPLKRNYSVSSAPDGVGYRISVKRESEGQGGSRHLHENVQVGDVIEATVPAGDFFLDSKPGRPVVLLSGGVGLTPMVSMLEAIAASEPDREAQFIHGALNGTVHAMGAHVRDLAKRHGGISVATFYSAPGADDVLGSSHDAEGFISADWLKANTPVADADYYLCGPRPFLRAVVAGLGTAGVPAERIRYEFFGPTDEAIAA